MKAKRYVKPASDARHRNWQMLLYSESCCENWKEFLIECGLSWIASPLHDKDLNDDGSLKKPHYHLYLSYEGMKSYKQVLETVAEPIQAVFPDIENVVVIHNMKAAICYLTHDGFNDKAQYSQALIQKSVDFDIDRFTQITENEQDEIMFQIIDYIDEYNILEIHDLIQFCRLNQNDWFRVLKHKTLFFNHYITSKRNKEKEGQSID